MKLIHIVGARPNYMKIAPIMLDAARYPNEFRQVLVHTGQHYDANMSDIFFDDLQLPTPNYHLNVGSGSHAEQTARVMLSVEPVLVSEKPDMVVVAGDVNSTLACALVAVKLGIPVSHVEAGLRSFDWGMPEEINRVVTDRLSSVLFTPSPDADEHLRAEGIDPSRIVRVGNVMIDTLVRLLPVARSRWKALQSALELEQFILVTLHRPSNVDDPAALHEILSALDTLGAEQSIVFPVHPRTAQRIAASGYRLPPTLKLVEPLGYLDFLGLEQHARLVITDSGGVQEETTFLGIPCLTLRENTERPITITHGTNRLVRPTRSEILHHVRSALESGHVTKSGHSQVELWDGRAAGRIVSFLRAYRDSI